MSFTPTDCRSAEVNVEPVRSPSNILSNSSSMFRCTRRNSPVSSSIHSEARVTLRPASPACSRLCSPGNSHRVVGGCLCAQICLGEISHAVYGLVIRFCLLHGPMILHQQTTSPPQPRTVLTLCAEVSRKHGFTSAAVSAGYRVCSIGGFVGVGTRRACESAGGSQRCVSSMDASGRPHAQRRRRIRTHRAVREPDARPSHEPRAGNAST